MRDIIILLSLLSGTTSACAQSINVTNDQGLNFGNFCQVSDSGGEITISNNGTRSYSGDIAVFGTTYFHSIFTITTNHSSPLTLTIDQPMVILSGNNGGVLELQIGPSNPNLPSVSSGSPVEVHIGGTLTIKNTF